MFFHQYPSLAKGLGRLAIAATGLLATSGYAATQCQTPTPIPMQWNGNPM